MTHHLVKIPPMLAATIAMGISSLDGVLFKDVGSCPHCGGVPMPYDTKVKQYASLITPDGIREIQVKVRRFTCRSCGALIYADEPFYPDTRVGSVVIDLALSLSRAYTFSHTAVIMEALGLNLSRGSVRHYAQSDLPMPSVSSLYGMPMPDSIVSLMGGGLTTGSMRAESFLKASGYPSHYIAPEDGTGTAAAYQRQKEMPKYRRGSIVR